MFWKFFVISSHKPTSKLQKIHSHITKQLCKILHSIKSKKSKIDPEIVLLKNISRNRIFNKKNSNICLCETCSQNLIYLEVDYTQTSKLCSQFTNYLANWRFFLNVGMAKNESVSTSSLLYVVPYYCSSYHHHHFYIIIIVLVMIIINNIPAPFPCNWLFLFTTSTKPLNSRHKKSSLLNRTLHIHMPGGTWLCMCDLLYETFAGDIILYNPIPRAFLVD